ncbi:MAG TPA: hypothetical protein VD997_04660 [Phycisphaerales bacterium]|nr:hypothetical protein [Phycisphaerales bacterium]
MHPTQLIAAATGALLAGACAAQPTFISQQRVIAATTTFNENTVTASAPDFNRFTEVVAAAIPFETPEGLPAPNEGETGIDCEIDPNAIRARGTLAGAGGITVNGVPVFGEAEALVEVTFSVTQPTPYRIRSKPRPSTNPRDEFEIELQNTATNAYLYRINENAPAQFVDTSGTLQPGTYVIHYEVEFTHDAGFEVRNFDFNFQIGQTCGTSDFNGDGDSATDQDIEAFFACIGGSCCDTCYSADFNGDGDAATDQDIESFFRVIGGHPC